MPGKKGVPPPATLKFPFAVLQCLVRGGGKGKGDLWHWGGKLNGNVCTQTCARVSQTGPQTTRIDILFGRKHNKTHQYMVQKEEGVILKVNKQRRRVVKVLLSFYHSRGGSQACSEGRNWGGFLTPVPLLVFHLWCSWRTCFLCESAYLVDTSCYLFVWLLGDSVCLQTLLTC